MKIKEWNTVIEAICSFTTKDKNYVFVRHTFQPGEKVKLHYHRKANEWMIIDNGKFLVKVGSEKKQINVKNKVLIIHFPKGQPHSFLPKTKVSYFVFRDCKDKIIYVKGDKDDKKNRNNKST